MESGCIFCKIANKEIPCQLEYEDEFCMAFPDIRPRAKTHILIIPKKHIPTVNELADEDEKTMGRIMITARNIARKYNLEHYKLLISVGEKGGQEIFHLHLHLMSAPD
ncbi:histidine triad nucleotide-binding protein [Patescibacteria group bacterium]|nr:histidine triad nucleotide-binding protein [Patescibacteria group bacterium]